VSGGQPQLVVFGLKQDVAQHRERAAGGDSAADDGKSFGKILLKAAYPHGALPAVNVWKVRGLQIALPYHDAHRPETVRCPHDRDWMEYSISVAKSEDTANTLWQACPSQAGAPWMNLRSRLPGAGAPPPPLDSAGGRSLAPATAPDGPPQYARQGPAGRHARLPHPRHIPGYRSWARC